MARCPMCAKAPKKSSMRIGAKPDFAHPDFVQLDGPQLPQPEDPIRVADAIAPVETKTTESKGTSRSAKDQSCFRPTAFFKSYAILLITKNNGSGAWDSMAASLTTNVSLERRTGTVVPPPLCGVEWDLSAGYRLLRSAFG